MFVNSALSFFDCSLSYSVIFSNAFFDRPFIDSIFFPINTSLALRASSLAFVLSEMSFSLFRSNAFSKRWAYARAIFYFSSKSSALCFLLSFHCLTCSSYVRVDGVLLALGVDLSMAKVFSFISFLISFRSAFLCLRISALVAALSSALAINFS